MLLKIERTIMQKTSSRKGNEISLSEIGKYDGEDVYQAFLGLKEMGYFQQVNSSIDRKSFTYLLTARGRYYKEHLRLQFLKNILIPFLVALITATATYHLEKVADEYTRNGSQDCGYELNCPDNQPIPPI